MSILLTHLLDLLVSKLTRGHYTLMPVDTLDMARGSLNSNVNLGDPALNELDEEIYYALCGRSCEVHNRFIRPIKTRLP